MFCNVKDNFRNKKLTYTAMFAAIAAVLMFIEFPLPFMPPFLKVDLSGCVSMIAAFMMGPLPALAVTFVKDIVHVFSSSTGGAGELADFICTGMFSVSACLVYRRYHTKGGALFGCAVGTAFLTVAGMFANKFLLIPFYSKVMPIDAIISACSAVNPLIGNINTYILFGAGPFNLIKGIILSLITFMLYKRLSVWIKSSF